jgi:hypothetical protein
MFSNRLTLIHAISESIGCIVLFLVRTSKSFSPPIPKRLHSVTCATFSDVSAIYLDPRPQTAHQDLRLSFFGEDIGVATINGLDRLVL